MMKRVNKSAAVLISAMFGTLRMLTVEGCSDTGLLDIYLTTSLAIQNFGNMWPIDAFFVSKCSKFALDFRNAGKNREKDFIS